MKPANLIVDSRGTLKILDMGLARFSSRVGDALDTDTGGLTQTGQIIGTVDFMSPEQAEDTRNADEQSDIYSLGCTLFVLLAARPPITGDTLIKKFLAHREAAIPSLRDRRSETSDTLDAVFRKMVAKKATDRYQSMSDLAVALNVCTKQNEVPQDVASPKHDESKSQRLTIPKTTEQTSIADSSVPLTDSEKRARRGRRKAANARAGSIAN